MRKLLRFILRSLIGLTLLLLTLAIVLPIGVYFFFDPNDFKPQISAYLSDKTNLPLTIEGSMEFTVFPWLGLKAENVNVEQAPNFGESKFIHIKEIDLKIPLHDLLRKHLVIESLRVKGLNVQLVKQKNGKTNWEHYSQKLTQTAKNDVPNSPLSTPTSKKTTSPHDLTFALKHFDVKGAKVVFVDNKAKQTWTVDSLSLNGEHSKKSIFPVSVAFDLSLTPFNQSSTVTGKAKLDGQVSLEKRWIDLTSSLSFTMPDSKWKHGTLDANLKGNIDKQIKVQGLKLKTSSTEVNGSLTYPIDAKETIIFSLNANEFDLNPYLNLSTTPTAKASSKVSKKSSSPSSEITETSNERTIQGELSVGKLQVKNVTLYQVNTSVKKQGANLNLNPFTATIFDGKLNVNITHSLAQNAAPTSLQGRLSGLTLAPVLRAFNKPDKINGTANIDFNLASTRSGFHGVIKCNVSNGVIQGIDINYYLAKAQSIIKKITSSVPDTKQTTFNSLSATLNLHDDIIDNNDLIILSQDFKAKGEGSIYLNSQTIEYKLQASKVYNDGKEHPNAFPLAIRIKGPLQNPKIEPDLDIYVKKLMNNELNQHLDKQLQKGLNKLLGDKSGDADNANPNAEDIVKEKIEKEVGKGLKKIFKIK